MTGTKMGALDGRRILVVEDDYFLAQDMCQILETGGAQIVGPASRVAEGLALAQDTADLDFALLDLNLAGESASEIAVALTSRSVPFVLVTGYDVGGIAQEISNAPRLVKPIDEDDLIRTVEREIAASRK